MTRIKICGITNLEDARSAAEAGADALGFVFADSPRRVGLDQVAAVCSKLPPYVVKVGVFAGQPAAAAATMANAAGLDAIQLHDGDDYPIGVHPVRPSLRIIRVARVSGREDAVRASVVLADAILLDSRVKGLAGGTGIAFDWSLLDGVSFASPLIISGGINSGNVAEVIERFRPYAVDVSSGVESEPGKKEPVEIRAFIEAVRTADKKKVSF